MAAERGERHDGGLYRQCVYPQRGDGLSAAGMHGPPGGAAPAAGTVSSLGAAGRRLRIGGLSSGAFLPFLDAGEDRIGSTAGSGGLWRGGEAGAADAAVFCPLLRHGRVRAGIGAPLRRRTHDGGRFLYGRGRPGAAHRRGGGLRRYDGGVPGGGQAGTGGTASEGPGVPGGPGGNHDGASRHRECPAPSRLRPTGAGDGPGRAGERSAVPGAAAFDAGAAALPGGPAGAFAGGGAAAAVFPGALPDGGAAGGSAADGAQRLDGGGRDALPGLAGGDLRRRRGRRLCRAVGRQCNDGRAT